jgi:hypothetical protein
MLIDIARSEDLFHTAIGTAFADVMIDGHRETWPVRSKRFRSFLRRSYYQATGQAASVTEIRSTLELLEARAQFDGPERAVHVRIAEHAGHIYLDLADEHWHVVNIGPDGWRVIERPPVRFRRPAGMLPLPFPERGGSIETLQSFFNVSSQDDFVLIVAWLLAALRSRGPYPLLAISGEQGSAKTVLSKLLKALIDPNTAPARALSREERELMIAANNGYVLAFDNLSGLPNWLSDALCRLATGGSFAVRRLYTDDEEMLFEVARPILLNGIEEVVNRPDLGDRAIFLTLAPISETSRRSEAELRGAFEIERPRILGALLGAVSYGIRAMGRVRVDALPRLADFALWATACEPALWPAGTFARAYAANRSAAIDSIIEDDPVASRIRAMMASRTTWIGSASDLLLLCSEGARDGMSGGSGLAKNARALAGRLRRAQTLLRSVGIEITFSREGRTGSRMIRVSTNSKNCVSTVSIVGACRSNGGHGDPHGVSKA